MSDYSSGVSAYIRGTATVEVYFPVDERGNADVNCYQCEYFHRTSNRCGLNKQDLRLPAEKYRAVLPTEF